MNCYMRESRRASHLDCGRRNRRGPRLGVLWNWENGRMSNPRYERILASTALALILAAPIGAIAQDAGAPATPSAALAESGRVAAPSESAAKAAEAGGAAGGTGLSVGSAAPI